MPDFISKHPKLTYLLVGLLMGSLLAYVVGRSSKQTASIYKEQIFKLETELARTQFDYQQVSSQNKELSTRLKEEVIEIVRADGSRETRRSTDSSEDSKEQKISEIKLKYEQELLRLQAEYQERTIVNNKMGLGLAVDIKGNIGPIVRYDFNPYLSAGGSILMDEKTLDNIILFGIIQF